VLENSVYLTLRAFGVREREISPPLAAMKEFRQKQALTVTGGYEGEEKTASGRIRFFPFSRWVLE
jgi:hypothetical protein